MAQCPMKSMTPKEMIEQASRKKKEAAAAQSSAPPRRLSSYRLPPGPKPDSAEADFIENELQLYKKIVQRYIPRYGSILTIYKEDTPCIIINEIELAYQIFVTKFGKQIAGRTASYGERLLSGNRNNILNSDYGPMWQALQRCLHRGLRHCASNDRMDEMMQRCFPLLRDSINSRGGAKAAGIKVEEDIFWTSDNLMTMLLFNEVFSDSDYDKFSKVLMEVPNRVDACEFPTPKKRSENQAVEKLKGCLDRLFPIVQKRIEEHRQRGDYKISCLDITDFVLLGVEEYKMDPLTRKLDVELTDVHVRHTIVDAMFASQEGLGNSFLWLLGLLALHPNIQEGIRREMDNMRDDHKTLPSLHWKLHMPYTMASVCEMQRFACADAFTDFHVALADIQVPGTGGYEIPRGALVLLNIYAVHHDARRWSEPHLVRPERFLTTDKAGEQKFRRPKDFVPYGLGLRTCTGNAFSENLLFLFVTFLLDHYRLVWSKNRSNQLQDASSASFIRDIEPFNVQFVPLH